MLILFLAFLGLTCHLEDTVLGVFPMALCCLRVRRLFGSCDQEASPSAGKKTRVVLLSCLAWKCVPTIIFGGVDIFKFPGRHLLWQMSSHWGSQKLLQTLVSHELKVYLSVFDLFLTHKMAILSKGHEPDNFESNNSLRLSLSFISRKIFRFLYFQLTIDFISFSVLVLFSSNDLLLCCYTWILLWSYLY